MRHTFLVVTVKNYLQSVYIYGSFRNIKIGVSLFGPLCIFTIYEEGYGKVAFGVHKV